MLDVATALVATIPVLAAARHCCLAPLSDVISLNNHNFRVAADGHVYLLRLASEHGRWLGIRRAEEAAAARAAAAAGVAPEMVWSDAQGNHLLTWLEGRHWQAADFADQANRQRLAAVVRQLHAVRGVAANGRVGDRINALLVSAAELGLTLPAEVAACRAQVRALEEARRADPRWAEGLCHNDLWANNFLDDGERLWLVDWEFGGLGDGLYDVATLCRAGGFNDTQQQEFLLWCGYRERDWDQLQQMQTVVAMFEGCWALVMHALRGSAGFDYLTSAQSTFRRLAPAPSPVGAGSSGAEVR
ncbi:MAG: phosphotransferase family protein [Fimbriimonadaceae bacterium]|nr:phosphotransferase family protein [Fimbriimonadaceae bacterium]